MGTERRTRHLQLLPLSPIHGSYRARASKAEHQQTGIKVLEGSGNGLVCSFMSFSLTISLFFSFLTSYKIVGPAMLSISHLSYSSKLRHRARPGFANLRKPRPCPPPLRFQGPFIPALRSAEASSLERSPVDPFCSESSGKAEAELTQRLGQNRKVWDSQSHHQHQT